MSPRGRVIAEVLGAFALATFAVSVLYRLRGVAFIEQNLAVLAAVLFLYLPAFILWRGGRDLDGYALRVRPLGRGLLYFAALTLVTVPLFTLGYRFWVHHGCLLFQRVMHARWLFCPPAIPPALRLPPAPHMVALSQLVVVALPEEFFFRGYLQGRLGEVLSRRAAWLWTAVLFALGHYLIAFDPASLAVFFPGLLFGLLRIATGSVLAGALFHAMCNVLIDVLHRSFG